MDHRKSGQERRRIRASESLWLTNRGVSMDQANSPLCRNIYMYIISSLQRVSKHKIALSFGCLERATIPDKSKGKVARGWKKRNATTMLYIHVKRTNSGWTTAKLPNDPRYDDPHVVCLNFRCSLLVIVANNTSRKRERETRKFAKHWNFEYHYLDNGPFIIFGTKQKFYM